MKLRYSAMCQKKAGNAAYAQVRHEVYVLGQRTTFRFDNTTWDALLEAAEREGIGCGDICARFIADKPPATMSMITAVRVGLIQYYRAAATPAGHERAGHGKRMSDTKVKSH